MLRNYFVLARYVMFVEGDFFSCCATQFIVCTSRSLNLSVCKLLRDLSIQSLTSSSWTSSIRLYNRDVSMCVCDKSVSVTSQQAGISFLPYNMPPSLFLEEEFFERFDLTIDDDDNWWFLRTDSALFASKDRTLMVVMHHFVIRSMHDSIKKCNLQKKLKFNRHNFYSHRFRLKSDRVNRPGWKFINQLFVNSVIFQSIWDSEITWWKQRCVQ